MTIVQLDGGRMTDLSASIDAIAAASLDAGLSPVQVYELIEEKMFAGALLRTGGNVTAASGLLHIHRNTFHNRQRARKPDIADLKRQHSKALRTAARIQQEITRRGPASHRRR